MALNYSEGLVNVVFPTKPSSEILYSSRWSCPDDGFSLKKLNRDCFLSIVLTALALSATAWEKKVFLAMKFALNAKARD